MNIRPLVISACVLLSLLWLAFNRAPTAAPAPVAAAPAVALRILPAEHVPAMPSMPAGTNTHTFECLIAEFHDRDLPRFGLAHLFASPQRTNELQANAIGQSGVMQLKRQFTNVVLLPPGSEFFAGKCAADEASKLLQQFGASAGVDLVTAPRVTTFAGRDARITIQNTRAIMISPPFTTNLATGIDIGLKAVPTEGGILLETAATYQGFLGYANPKSDKTAEPRLVLLAGGIRTELGTNEVLLLGFPAHERLVTTVERARWLGSLPVIGDSIFTKRRVQTNRLRQLLIIRQVN